MKIAGLLSVMVMTAAAYAGEESPAIVGKWTWTRAQTGCTEIYDYRPDGTLQVQSGAEKTDNTYSISSGPDRNGFFKMILKVVRDYGGTDCAELDEDSTGQENTVYVLFHSSRPIHAVCRDSNLEACYGPLHRVSEE